MPTSLILVVLLITTALAAVILLLRLRGVLSERHTLAQELASLTDRFRDVVDVDNERCRILGEIEVLRERAHEQKVRLYADHQKALEITHEQRQQSEVELESLRSRCDTLVRRISL